MRLNRRPFYCGYVCSNTFSTDSLVENVPFSEKSQTSSRSCRLLAPPPFGRRCQLQVEVAVSLHFPGRRSAVNLLTKVVVLWHLPVSGKCLQLLIEFVVFLHLPPSSGWRCRLQAEVAVTMGTSRLRVSWRCLALVASSYCYL